MAPIGPVKSVTIKNPHFSTGDSGVERISIATKTTERAVSTNQVRIIPSNIWNSHNATSERTVRDHFAGHIFKNLVWAKASKIYLRLRWQFFHRERWEKAWRSRCTDATRVGGVRLGQERCDHFLRASRHGGREMSDPGDDHVGGVWKRSGRDFPPTRRRDGVEAARQDQGWNGAARNGPLRRRSLRDVPTAAVGIHMAEVDGRREHGVRIVREGEPSLP